MREPILIPKPRKIVQREGLHTLSAELEAALSRYTIDANNPQGVSINGRK